MTAIATQPEVAPADEPTSVALVRRDPLLDAVGQWDKTMALGTSLVKSGFLPRAINTPEKAVAVILAGREMGIGPMQAVRSINIIDGKPVVSADLQLARFKADGGRASFTELSDKRAVLELVHPNGDPHTETFTTEDAKAAGLLNKDNWKKFPKAMMRSRVITAGLKSVGYEPMAGVYDPDEADHFRPAPAAAPAKAKATAKAAPAAKTPEEADSVDFSVEDGSGADAEGVSKNPEDRLADAMAFKLPGGPKAWGGKGGTPLGELPASLLQRIAKWTIEKLAEEGKPMDDPDADQVKVAVVQNIEIILEAKGAEAAKNQTELGLSGDLVKDAAAQQAAIGEGEKRPNPTPAPPSPVAAAGESPTKTSVSKPSAKPPKGGTPTTSSSSTAATEPPSVMALYREIQQLLESADRSDDEKAAIRKALDRAQTAEQMQKILKDLALPV